MFDNTDVQLQIGFNQKDKANPLQMATYFNAAYMFLLF